MTRKIYGWEEDGAFFLSPFPRSKGGPKNQYADRAALDAEIARRNPPLTNNIELVWEE